MRVHPSLWEGKGKCRFADKATTAPQTPPRSKFTHRTWAARLCKRPPRALGGDAQGGQGVALLVLAGADVDLIVEHVDRARGMSADGFQPR